MSIKLFGKKKTILVCKQVYLSRHKSREWFFNLAFYIIGFFFLVGFIHLT